MPAITDLTAFVDKFVEVISMLNLDGGELEEYDALPAGEPGRERRAKPMDRARLAVSLRKCIRPLLEPKVRAGMECAALRSPLAGSIERLLPSLCWEASGSTDVPSQLFAHQTWQEIITFSAAAGL